MGVQLTYYHAPKHVTQRKERFLFPSTDLKTSDPELHSSHVIVRTCLSFFFQEHGTLFSYFIQTNNYSNMHDFGLVNNNRPYIYAYAISIMQEQ